MIGTVTLHQCKIVGGPYDGTYMNLDIGQRTIALMDPLPDIVFPLSENTDEVKQTINHRIYLVKIFGV